MSGLQRPAILDCQGDDVLGETEPHRMIERTDGVTAATPINQGMTLQINSNTSELAEAAA